MLLRYCKTTPTQQKSTAPNQCHYFTLWMRHLSGIKMHNIKAHNFKKTRPEKQVLLLFDLTSQQRLQRLHLMQKQVKIKSSARNYHCLKCYWLHFLRILCSSDTAKPAISTTKSSNVIQSTSVKIWQWYKVRYLRTALIVSRFLYLENRCV